MYFSSIEVKAKILGLQAFVCTPFKDDNEIDPLRFQEHLHDLADYSGSQPAGCFVCCGTGEFWSLDLREYKILVKAAVQEVGGRLPVLAGVGYGTLLAIEYARAAEEAGADGILVFPPYLVAAPQEGLFEHFRQIAKSTGMAVVVYSRDNAILESDTVIRLTEIPNIVGLKDGFGNMGLLDKFQEAVGDRLVFVNGMPSAEMYAESYFNVGVRSYSPGVFDFLPELSWIFDRALSASNKEMVRQLIDEFYKPYTLLRGKCPGYGVSLVKAGLRLRGKSVGGVRLPLMNPKREHIAELESLIERGLELARFHRSYQSANKQELDDVSHFAEEAKQSQYQDNPIIEGGIRSISWFVAG